MSDPVGDVFSPVEDAVKDIGRDIGDFAEDVTGITATRLQEDQIQSQQRQADLSNRRSIREQIRQARVARANTRSSARATGTSGGSGEFGVLSSIQSQLGSNINQVQESRNFQQEQLDLSRQIAQANLKQSLFQQGIQIAGTVFGGGAAGGAAGAAGGAAGAAGGAA